MAKWARVNSHERGAIKAILEGDAEFDFAKPVDLAISSPVVVPNLEACPRQFLICF